jgi:hypothetical protein
MDFIPEHYLMFISLLAFTVATGSQKLHFIQEAPFYFLTSSSELQPQLPQFQSYLLILKGLTDVGLFCYA